MTTAARPTGIQHATNASTARTLDAFIRTGYRLMQDARRTGNRVMEPIYRNNLKMMLMLRREARRNAAFYPDH